MQMNEIAKLSFEERLIFVLVCVFSDKEGALYQKLMANVADYFFREQRERFEKQLLLLANVGAISMEADRIQVRDYKNISVFLDEILKMLDAAPIVDDLLIKSGVQAETGGHPTQSIDRSIEDHDNDKEIVAESMVPRIVEYYMMNIETKLGFRCDDDLVVILHLAVIKKKTHIIERIIGEIIGRLNNIRNPRAYFRKSLAKELGMNKCGN